MGASEGVPVGRAPMGGPSGPGARGGPGRWALPGGPAGPTHPQPVGEAGAEALQVAVDAGRQVGVGAGRVPARHRPHHGGHRRGERDVPEPQLPRQHPDLLLVAGPAAGDSGGRHQ